jgi:hypothetical protein
LLRFIFSIMVINLKNTNVKIIKSISDIKEKF